MPNHRDLSPPSTEPEKSTVLSSESEQSFAYHAQGIDVEDVRRHAWPPSTVTESQDLSSFGEDGSLVVYSQKPPDEAEIFGLRGSDILDLRPAPGGRRPVSPDEWGFTNPTSDGVCKYCQLMLHPGAPSLVEHHPNIQRLISSCETCPFCNWLSVSLQRGLPWLVSSYQEGDPSLCDENNTTRPITVELVKFEHHVRATGIVGERQIYTNRGIPLTITTPSRLGGLATRRFWVPYDELDQTKPFERMEMIKTWLSDCENHEACRAKLPTTRNARLPTRILDLSGSPDIPSDPDDIVMKLRKTTEGEEGTYVALSYCWGSDSEFHFKTTQHTLPAHEDQIDHSSLPLTYREAILVTLYLGIRYLWIDSVCIIQDSYQDWAAESARMGSVYTNAHLTLAATGSDTPKEGLLLPFQGARCANIHGETTIVRMETHLTIDGESEPLNLRGWTLQETVLASRLVCFGQEQWLWKCPSRHATEDGLFDGEPSSNNGLIQWANLTDRGSRDHNERCLKHWYQLVMNYSNRRLTYDGDKSNAIAGLVDMFIRQTGYQYLSGVWAEDLASGLMWEATASGVIREPGRIPSWSWLSVTGKIKGYSYASSKSSMIELLDSQQEWEGVPLTSALKVARLTVKGLMFQVTLGKRSVTQESRHHIIAAPGSDEIFGEAFLDSKLSPEQQMPTVYCLFVQKDTKDAEYAALLLAPMDASKDCRYSTYRRLGIAVIWKVSRFYVQGREGNDISTKASSATVVLV